MRPNRTRLWLAVVPAIAIGLLATLALLVLAPAPGQAQTNDIGADGYVRLTVLNQAVYTATQTVTTPRINEAGRDLTSPPADTQAMFVFVAMESADITNTLTITPQTSVDGVYWSDVTWFIEDHTDGDLNSVPASGSLSAPGATYFPIPVQGSRLRFRVSPTVVGASPMTVTLDLLFR